jgi:hypothetical protein
VNSTYTSASPERSVNTAGASDRATFVEGSYFDNKEILHRSECTRERNLFQRLVLEILELIGRFFHRSVEQGMIEA